MVGGGGSCRWATDWDICPHSHCPPGPAPPGAREAESEATSEHQEKPQGEGSTRRRRESGPRDGAKALATPTAPPTLTFKL